MGCGKVPDKALLEKAKSNPLMSYLFTGWLRGDRRTSTETLIVDGQLVGEVQRGHRLGDDEYLWEAVHIAAGNPPPLVVFTSKDAAKLFLLESHNYSLPDEVDIRYVMLSYWRGVRNYWERKRESAPAGMFEILDVVAPFPGRSKAGDSQPAASGSDAE